MAALAKCNGLMARPDPARCTVMADTRMTPPPSSHLHVEGFEIYVGLYLQRETLWFLPPLDCSLLKPDQVGLPQHFTLASDQTVFRPWRPGRGAGVFETGPDIPAVVVPRPHILLEAYMRLFGRDQGKRVGSFAISMIAYMGLYVDEDGLLDVSQVPEPLRTFYEEFRGGKKKMRPWMLELKEALGVDQDTENDDGY